MNVEKWRVFVNEVAQRLTVEDEITLAIDDIVSETGTTDRSVRGRTFWLAISRGGWLSDAFARARVLMDFTPNELGADVKFVTFRPAEIRIAL